MWINLIFIFFLSFNNFAFATHLYVFQLNENMTIFKLLNSNLTDEVENYLNYLKNKYNESPEIFIKDFFKETQIFLNESIEEQVKDIISKHLIISQNGNFDNLKQKIESFNNDINKLSYSEFNIKYGIFFEVAFKDFDKTLEDMKNVSNFPEYHCETKQNKRKRKFQVDSHFGIIQNQISLYRECNKPIYIRSRDHLSNGFFSVYKDNQNVYVSIKSDDCKFLYNCDYEGCDFSTNSKKDIFNHRKDHIKNEVANILTNL